MHVTFTRPGEGRIRFYLDSAQKTDFSEWLATGLFYGVTANPTVLAAAGVACTLPALTALVHAALEHGIHEVHLQTWGATAELMFEHGKSLSAINHRVVVEVPITRTGVQAVRLLRSRDIASTFTALYEPYQALTAAVVGAEYAVPYLDRIDTGGRDGFAAIAAMRTILTGLDNSTRLLVSGIRSAEDVGRLALSGIDSYTFGPAVAAELFANAQTIDATAVFEQAAAAV